MLELIRKNEITESVMDLIAFIAMLVLIAVFPHMVTVGIIAVSVVGVVSYKIAKRDNDKPRHWV